MLKAKRRKGTQMVKKVLLIFKTHLDIGYTDLSKNVADRYFNEFIPKAIEIGYALKNSDTPFIWTVGSWLVWEGLKRDHDGSLERALRDGIISWHALPFTMHTEIMSGKLFDYGLSLSKRLDKRFGVKTIAAKMTDVPGHTAAIVPHLAQAGVKLLHIGVNSACPVPNVPEIFRWKHGSSEITVIYNGGYGLDTVIGDTAVVFGHTNDNLGPQSCEEVKTLYKEIESRYPGAEIRAATLNDAADAVDAVPPSLFPVVDGEIGDTWIYGMASDPKKLAGFRELQRYYDSIETDKELDDSLLCVPEHTWGLNLQTNLRDREHWFLKDFEPLRETLGSRLEASWKEQRDYVTLAGKALNKDPWEALKFEIPVRKPTSQSLNEAPPARVFCQLFDQRDNERYLKKYIKLPEVEWANWDFTKYGIPTEYTGGSFDAEIKEAWMDGDKKVWKCDFDSVIKERHGLPTVYIECSGKYISIKTTGKKCDRMPQALWVKFDMIMGQIEINKMGEWTDVSKAAGNPLLSGFYSGIRDENTELISYDCGLVAPFGPHLYDFMPVDLTPDPTFCLYNNCWNTNFPMWFQDDMNFRFEIKKIA